MHFDRVDLHSGRCEVPAVGAPASLWPAGFEVRVGSPGSLSFGLKLPTSEDNVLHRQILPLDGLGWVLQGMAVGCRSCFTWISAPEIIRAGASRSFTTLRPEGAVTDAQSRIAQ